jgi:leader peptidase (prepilin peptidase)/N-methyltransferase
MIVLMEHVTIMIILAGLGLCMGSFAGATVWRLRARQLASEEKDLQELHDHKKTGEVLSDEEIGYAEELRKTKSQRVSELKQLRPIIQPARQDRSRCLHCHHELSWYDLVPLVSWISTKGRCRYCRAPIGWFEPLMELGTAALFVISYVFWPEALDTTAAIAHFGLWLVAVVMLVILFAYDLKWFLLPDVIVFPLMAVGALVAILRITSSSDVASVLLSLMGSVLILSGLYWGLHRISKGQWVGYGDVKLGLALALLVGDWQLAFIALFAANLIGCLLVIPGMIVGKISRMTRVPFGPLLIAGAVIAILGGWDIVDWYMRALA